MSNEAGMRQTDAARNAYVVGIVAADDFAAADAVGLV